MITGVDRSASARRRVREVFSRVCFATLCLAWSICACAAAASPAPGEWGLERLMQQLGQVRSTKAKFVERKELAILSAPLEFSGTLIYTAPGRLEKHTLRPRTESLILDERTLTIEDHAKRRRTLVLQEHPIVWAFVESIRSTLAGDLQSLNRFYEVNLRGDERNWHLTLKPRDPRMQTVVDEIGISGSRNLVRIIQIDERRGDRSVMTITDIIQ
jgi:hypothetical protein